MRPRRPRRRGDWGRRLPSLSGLDSPLSSDSDAFPCDSSCSGDSFSSQDYYPPEYRRRRIRSTPVLSNLSPLSDPRDPRCPSRPHDLALPSRIEPYQPRLPPLDIRDVSLTEYAAAELPDIGIFLKGMLPGFGGSHSPRMMYGGSPRGIPRRRSVPSGSQRGDGGNRRPPMFPDSRRPSQLVEFAKRHDIVTLKSHLQSKKSRQDGMKRLGRSCPNAGRGKVGARADTRRYAGDVGSGKAKERKDDPDCMRRFFLLERICSMYEGVVGRDGR